jgi:hypothetical protein
VRRGEFHRTQQQSLPILEARLKNEEKEREVRNNRSPKKCDGRGRSERHSISGSRKITTLL